MDQFAKFLQAVGYRAVVGYPDLPVHLHLLMSALLPIYAGAHASLSRPSSAAKPSNKTKKQYGQHDEAEEQEQTMEGLGPIDALLLPLFAGLSLTSLYFLIVWLEDPALLNKILNWYFAGFGVWSLTRMIKDIMGLITSFISPQTYDIDGNALEIDVKQRRFRLTSSPSVERDSPVPEPSSAPPLPSKITNAMWTLRKLSSRQLDVRVYIHQIVEAQFKIGPQDVTSIFLAVVALLYFNLIGKPWWLTNLLGFGFAYSALQIMSPTTSWTGTLILAALFVYDIYFVFFTPLMVTVATQLDIPAKLVFPRPRRPTEDPTKQALSMLGLGDIILPGMMIGFALRFDLYLFYLRKQTRRTVKNSNSTANAAETPASKEADDFEVVKPTWHPAAGGWGERFWTRKEDIVRLKQFQGGLFPKTYFRASVVGYVLGMLCTIGVMEIYGQAQPALLYLVPGVLGSLWGTALVKGDIKTLWNFDEAEEEKKVETRGGKETEDSAWKADRWLGVNWKSVFFAVQRSLNDSKQLKDIHQNDEISDQATNGQSKSPEKSRSGEDLSEKSKSSKPSHGESTEAQSDSETPEAPKISQATNGSRKEDKAKGAFDRDRKSELLFISVNLLEAAPAKPKKTSIPEQVTSSARLAHSDGADTKVEDGADDGLGETY
ncbi:MAG: hypothetical protein ALECFALPRED_007691 [Alectoria fallacina]|uniref:Signal peptide peptidase n=1 Tax=Alectoria fallacina TaxID=1903189 RepID=A0A8H3PDA6_9LECA|nr:MAG: hypothetical protein ALECFALPRED_007691 [Alectoria fallacina]